MMSVCWDMIIGEFTCRRSYLDSGVSDLRGPRCIKINKTRQTRKYVCEINRRIRSSNWAAGGVPVDGRVQGRSSLGTASEKLTMFAAPPTNQLPSNDPGRPEPYNYSTLHIFYENSENDRRSAVIPPLMGYSVPK